MSTSPCNALSRQPNFIAMHTLFSIFLVKIWTMFVCNGKSIKLPKSNFGAQEKTISNFHHQKHYIGQVSKEIYISWPMQGTVHLQEMPTQNSWLRLIVRLQSKHFWDPAVFKTMLNLQCYQEVVCNRRKPISGHSF